MTKFSPPCVFCHGTGSIQLSLFRVKLACKKALICSTLWAFSYWAEWKSHKSSFLQVMKIEKQWSTKRPSPFFPGVSFGPTEEVQWSTAMCPVSPFIPWFFIINPPKVQRVFPKTQIDISMLCFFPFQERFRLSLCSPLLVVASKIELELIDHSISGQGFNPNRQWENSIAIGYFYQSRDIYWRSFQLDINLSHVVLEHCPPTPPTNLCISWSLGASASVKIFLSGFDISQSI